MNCFMTKQGRKVGELTNLNKQKKRTRVKHLIPIFHGLLRVLHGSIIRGIQGLCTHSHYVSLFNVVDAS